MLNCKQTSQLVSQSLDRQLTFKERLAVSMHLLICKYCKRFQLQLLAVRRGLKQVSQAIEDDASIMMSPEAKARIAKQLDSQEE